MSYEFSFDSILYHCCPFKMVRMMPNCLFQESSVERDDVKDPFSEVRLLFFFACM